ncbi:MAG: P-II family nitrogen regulator [Thermodesulfobacteriota bacterium]
MGCVWQGGKCKTRVRIKIMAKAEMTDETIATIQKNAHTGNKGDGTIFVPDIERAVRKRAGDKDEEVIWSSLKDE